MLPGKLLFLFSMSITQKMMHFKLDQKQAQINHNKFPMFLTKMSSKLLVISDFSSDKKNKLIDSLKTVKYWFTVDHYCYHQFSSNHQESDSQRPI